MRPRTLLGWARGCQRDLASRPAWARLSAQKAGFGNRLAGLSRGCPVQVLPPPAARSAAALGRKPRHICSAGRRRRLRRPTRGRSRQSAIDLHRPFPIAQSREPRSGRRFQADFQGQVTPSPPVRLQHKALGTKCSRQLRPALVEQWAQPIGHAQYRWLDPPRHLHPDPSPHLQPAHIRATSYRGP